MRFRQKPRITQDGFKHILGRISSHLVLKNASQNKQNKLTVALYRFGKFRNGAS